MKGIALGLALLAACGQARAADDLLTAPLARQQAAMASGQASAESLASAYLARIEALNHKGPRLNAVIAVSPAARADARARDGERRAGRAGPLQGAAILLKDNIETAGLPATAGSLALSANVPSGDAPLVRRLRAAGAVVLGKANLSEWANFRASRSISGWSAVGGLTRNPYGLDRSACGSSAGSAAAVAAGMAAAAVGTETDGSVTCPAAMNGLVGLKPTVGLVSRTGVVPISPVQDTPGPITRTVADAALLLAAMAGSDPADPATRDADAHRADYPALLDAGSLKGARLGVLRKTQGRSPEADAVFAAALDRLKAAGAVLVEVASPDETQLGAAESLALKAEFKAAIEFYLAATPAAVQARSLAALIAFDRSEPRELALFGQDTFEEALKAPDLTDPAYVAARDTARRLAGPEGIDRLLAENNLVALVALSNGPASVVDPVNGSVWLGSPSTLPAVAGYPHLTIPAGQVEGLPIGLSLIGPAWSEARLLSLGYAFEQRTGPLPPPSFQASVLNRPDIAPALDPHP